MIDEPKITSLVPPRSGFMPLRGLAAITDVKSYADDADSTYEASALPCAKLHRTVCVECLLKYTQMLRRNYIHQQAHWPRFHWNWERVSPLLASVRHHQGLLLGRVDSLGSDTVQNLTVESLTASVVSSSRIEGEILDVDQVRSSVARQLGFGAAGLVSVDRNVDGVVEMMLDATERCREPLTVERIKNWHRALFPEGFNNMGPLTVGDWRDDASGPMRVVSGPIGRPTVHFEAPPAELVDAEMEAFIGWLEAPADNDLVVMAAVAHLWFVTIHPLDDGNGRIARAITDMMLARSDSSSRRAYSMSEQILSERSAYYRVLEQTQRSTLDITDWMVWFLECLNRSIASSEEKLSALSCGLKPSTSHALGVS